VRFTYNQRSFGRTVATGPSFPPHCAYVLRDAFPYLDLVVMYLERMVIVRAVCKQRNGRHTTLSLPFRVSNPIPVFSHLHLSVHLSVRVRLDAERAVVSRRIRSWIDRSCPFNLTRFNLTDKGYKHVHDVLSAFACLTNARRRRARSARALPKSR
jgi:hypothetical protein